MFITITVIQAIMLFLAISLNILSIWCKRTSGQWLLMKIHDEMRCNVMSCCAICKWTYYLRGGIFGEISYLCNTENWNPYQTYLSGCVCILDWAHNIVALNSWSKIVSIFFLFCYRIITNLPNNTQMHTLTKNKKVYAETRYE